ANWLSQAILQWMGRSATGWSIDAEIGDLASDSLGGGRSMISYQRYDVSLEPSWLRTTLGVEMTESDCTALYAMANPENIGWLTRLGNSAAAAQVKPAHLPVAFDL